jgi:hypothetical protein
MLIFATRKCLTFNWSKPVIAFAYAVFLILTPIHAFSQNQQKGNIQKTPPKTSTKSSELIAQVNVRAKFTPVQASGLIWSERETGERAAISLQKIKENLYVVSFPYIRGEVRPDTYASAILTSKTGEIAFGEVRSLFGTGHKHSIYSIPACLPERSALTADRSRLGALEKLVEFRSQRRETYRKEIVQLLSPTFIDDLKRLESGFGLTSTNELSASLDPFELVERLSKLTALVEQISSEEEKI